MCEREGRATKQEVRKRRINRKMEKKNNGRTERRESCGREKNVK